MNEQIPALFRATVGDQNQEFYLGYIQRAEQRGYSPMSWNWPVFFFGFFWFLYRKQYIWALAIFFFPTLALIVSGIVEDLLPGMGQATLLTLVIGFHTLYLPLNANGIYYRWARREIERIQAEHPGQHQAQTEALKATGGCNRNLPFIIFGAFTAITLILGSLSVPPG